MCEITKSSWIRISNYRVYPVTYRTRSKRWSQNTGMFFVRMDSAGLSGDFNSRLTQVTIQLYAVNNLGTVLMILRLYKIWWKVWMKMVWYNKTEDHEDHWWF